jgi:hypothetical protein
MFVDSIRDQLQRAEMDFIHTRVDVVCIKDCTDTFPFFERRLGPFKSGHNYNLPFFVARILVEQGIGKLEEKDTVTSNTIRKINFQESSDKDMHKIDDHTYVQAIQQLRIYNAWYQQDKINRREYNQLNSDLDDMIRVRLGKINRLALANQNMKFINMMTPEEKALYEQLNKNVQAWRDFFGKIQ